MNQRKLEAGAEFPALEVLSLEGDTVDLGARAGDDAWKMVVVYRGEHCPMCTRYLNRLEEFTGRLADIDVEVVAVAGDSRKQLQNHLEDLDISFPVYYGLTLDQMRELGLYISHPRSPEETDHPFPEPGIFVINGDDRVQVVDISNNPFSRPDIETLVSGIEFIKDPENNYPIRGTYPKDPAA